MIIVAVLAMLVSGASFILGSNRGFFGGIALGAGMLAMRFLP